MVNKKQARAVGTTLPGPAREMRCIPSYPARVVLCVLLPARALNVRQIYTPRGARVKCFDLGIL